MCFDVPVDLIKANTVRFFKLPEMAARFVRRERRDTTKEKTRLAPGYKMLTKTDF